MREVGALVEELHTRALGKRRDREERDVLVVEEARARCYYYCLADVEGMSRADWRIKTSTKRSPPAMALVVVPATFRRRASARARSRMPTVSASEQRSEDAPHVLGQELHDRATEGHAVLELDGVAGARSPLRDLRANGRERGGRVGHERGVVRELARLLEAVGRAPEVARLLRSGADAAAYARPRS